MTMIDCNIFAQAVRSDTGLRVAALCGQNKTMKLVKSLYEDTYDVVVATAGAMVYMVESEQIFLNTFSCVVLDEAHHALGAHKYSHLLKHILKMPSESKPRVLGLTASPFRVKNLVKVVSTKDYIQFYHFFYQGRNKLDAMIDTFQTSAILKPVARRLDQEAPETMTVVRNETQSKFQKEILHCFVNLANEISKKIDDDFKLKEVDPEANNITTSEIGLLKGQINSIEENFSPKRKNDLEFKRKLEKLLCYLISLEIAESIGISAALELLRDNEIILDNIEEHKDVTELAPRYQILSQQLNRAKSDSKVLIFVDTRESARRLLKTIDHDFPHFQSQQVVGHGGWDGQQWVGNQEDIIENFHSGKCRLLVCTSVLEEGIDVSSCDLVIRYNGVSTLIQFIQSRGRARKKGSKFIVIVTEEELKRSQEIQEEEKIMDLILETHSQDNELPSKTTRQIIKKISCDNKSTEDLDFQINKQKYSYLPEHSIVEVFVEGAKNTNEEALRDEIDAIFDSVSLKLTRIEVYDKKAQLHSKCHFLFDKKDHVVLCHVQNSSGGDSISRYQSLSHGWNFNLLDNKLSAVTKIHCKGVQKPVLEWKLGTFAAGNFLDRQTFVQKFSFRNTDVRVSFSQTGHLMKISIGQDYRIECSMLKTSVLEFGLASWEKKECHLFIPLESIPVMLRKTGEDENNVRRETDHDFLKWLALYPVLMMKVSLEEENDWVKLRQMFSCPNVIPFPVFDSKIFIRIEEVEIFNVQNSLHLDNRFLTMDFDYKRKILNTEWKVLVKHSDLVMNAPQDEVENLMHEIRTHFINGNEKEAFKIGLACSFSSRKHESYWRPFKVIMNKERNLFRNVSESTISSLESQIPDNHIRLLRLVVTPSRIIYQPGVPVFTSRLTRMLAGSHNLIVVSFRDENMQDRLGDVFTRVEQFLTEGFDVCGRKFQFLCASASQIRDRKAFFVEVQTLDEIYSLRKLIISNPESFNNPAKYLSRLGLFCTADRPTIDIPLCKVKCIDDERSLDDGSLVTDGSGFITASCAKEIFEEIGEQVPSAFQFRYNGMKGVLTVVEDSYIKSRYPDAKMLYRPSQKKFDSDHTMMGVVKSATAHCLYLNREAITLLESLYRNAKERETWHLPTALINLQEKFLESQAEMFVSSIGAREALMQYLPSQDVKDAGEFFDLRKEPYWYRLLRHCHVFGVSDLCRKTNIPIKNGCLAMGIPDFTNTLGNDEIFLQVCKDDETPKIIEGSVFMYRNPCLHPGDLRIVQAVNRPELHCMRNVLVLPTKSDFSISAMCSGGDLDGDQFSVIWEKELVPPKRLQYKALDYQKLPGTAEEQESPWRQENLSRFFVACMRNEMLGRVAHMHLALCDILDSGAVDPMARKLAESQAVAVDYPKTGVAPKVPKEALDKVKDSGYPDFMQKKTAESYPSSKILGKLFQASKSYLFAFDISEEEFRKIPLDQSLLVPGYKKFVETAEQIYIDYAVDMKYLMHQFSLKSEEEVILGKAIKLHSLLDSDREKVMLSLRENFQALTKKYKNIIINQEKVGNNIEAMASACYYVAYNQNIKISNRPFLSFPWLFREYLTAIKRRDCGIPPKTLESVIHKELGESAKLVVTKLLPDLKNCVKEKEQIFDIVKKTVEEKHSSELFQITPYGSSSVFLCEAESDLDICISVQPEAINKVQAKDKMAFEGLTEVEKQRHFLETYISPTVDEIFDTKEDLIKLDVPVIKGSMKTASGEATNIDLSCNTVGLLKTNFLLRVFEENPETFVVFWIIVKWARYWGLVKYLDKDNSSFLTAEMYAIIVHLLRIKTDRNISSSSISTGMTKALSSLVAKLGTESYNLIGEKLHNFFKLGQSLPREELTICWPFPEAPDVVVAEANIYGFSKACSQSLHCLLATHRVTSVLKNALDCTETQTIFTKKLPLTLSHSIGPAPEFHASRLTRLTGANVSIDEEPGEDRLVLTAEGSRASIADLRIELSDLAMTKRALVIGVPAKQASRYFLAGSTLMLMKNCENENCRIGFVDSAGTYQLIHKAQQRSSPVLKYNETVDNETWLKNRAIPSLTDTMQKQLTSFQLEKAGHADTVELTTRFGTFYTVDIDSCLPKTQKTLSLQEFQETCEKGRTMRKSLDRGEFKRVKKNKPKFQMVELRQGKSQVDIADNKKSKLVRNKKQKSGISMSYNTGIANPDFEKTDGREQIAASEKIYEKVLANLGYESGCGHRNRNHRIYEEEHWKVVVNASTGYEITLNLDKDMNYVNMTERHLSWVHATIFHGKEVTASFWFSNLNLVS